MKHKDNPKTPPPSPGTGKPPNKNEVNLTELIDEYIEANKEPKSL